VDVLLQEITVFSVAPSRLCVVNESQENLFVPGLVAGHKQNATSPVLFFLVMKETQFVEINLNLPLKALMEPCNYI
jgi:hypothetical protein